VPLLQTSKSLLDAATLHLEGVDTIVLAQPSMAFCGDYLRAATGLRVLTAVDAPFGE